MRPRLKKHSKRIIFTIVTLFSSLFLLSLGVHIFNFQDNGDSFTVDISDVNLRRNGRNVKLILLYTRFFQEFWNDDSSSLSLKTPLLPGRAAFKHCEYNQCEITYSQDLLPLADAVGFHGPDLHTLNYTLPDRTRWDQIWFYYMRENPINYNISEHLNGVFNWSMTYRRKSEIYAPYGLYEPRGLDKDSGEIDLEYKDLLVAWMVSNCRGEERNQYVIELSKHIPVHIYGYCGFLKCPFPRTSVSCRLMIQRYKFYLAFENGNCDEYITEKYWENAIGNDVIPVVMGGGKDLSSLIPNSYIDVRDFKSPKDLADYLLYLNQNDVAYLQYFKWKRLYKLVPSNRACSMCAALHDNDLLYPPRVIENLREWWNKSDCRPMNLTNTTTAGNSIKISVALNNKLAQHMSIL